MWKIAWDNLRFNRRCSLLLIIMISITFASINLFYGYIRYTREGMALGFIEKSGDFQIARNSYWNNGGEESVEITGGEIAGIKEILAGKQIDDVECILEISGLIGNKDISRAFWGEAYDNPEKYGNLTDGEPVFSGDSSVVAGALLADSLGAGPSDYVTVLSSSQTEGICLGDFTLSGISSSGVVQQDKGFVVASRRTFLDFLGYDDVCSYIKVFLPDSKSGGKLVPEIEAALPEGFSLRTWQELNPSYGQIDELNSTQFFIISLILMILIAVSLTFSLITNFTGRLSEFGTMEAIGFTKFQIGVLMELETVLVALTGIVVGTGLFFLISGITKSLNVTIVPPGYSDGYKLVYLFDFREYVRMFLLVFGICFLSALYPVAMILRKTASGLMKR